MNRPLNRLVALAGAAFVGLFGALALATPAHAHHTTIAGTAVCQADGTFKIDWKLTNGNWDGRIARIETLTVTPNTAITGFAVGTEIAPDGSVSGTQTVPGNTTEAKLTVYAKWYKNGVYTGNDDWEDGKAAGLSDGCTPKPQPSVTFVSKCDGTINVHLVNPDKDDVKFIIKGANNNYSQEVSVAAGQQKDVSVPGSAGALTVTVDGQEIDKFAGWVRPEECPPPSVLVESTCDKFVLKLTNPQGGQSTEAKVTYGTQIKNVTVEPGKTETVELTPGSETEAVVEFSSWGRQVVKYTKPNNCPGLPQTGDNTVGYIGAGAGLIGLGAVVFFLARRRMVQLRRMAS